MFLIPSFAFNDPSPFEQLAKQKGLCLVPKSQKCQSQADLYREGVPKLGVTAKKGLFSMPSPSRLRDGTFRRASWPDLRGRAGSYGRRWSF